MSTGRRQSDKNLDNSLSAFNKSLWLQNLTQNESDWVKTFSILVSQFAAQNIII